ncbi:MAG: hypothetical protein F6K16_41155 [Symploca sp. SIO2B6]|nr:hypothetical protein [Symploca sp. SIO2B6]
MIEPGDVDVKDIQCDRQRSEFDENKIDELASYILETGTLVKPLLLKQNTFDSYTLLDGYLEYYAAVRARERDPRQAETVNAIVIPIKFDGNLDAVLNQVKLIKASPINVPDQSRKNQENLSRKNDKETDKENPSYWITSFENRLANIQAEHHENALDVDRRLRSLEKKEENDKNKVSLLVAFNTFNEDKLIRLFSQVKGKQESQKLAKGVINAREKEENQFFNCEHVVDSVKGLSDRTMLKLMEKGD